MQADIGLIGLAVMGQNLVLNMADHGFTVAVFNRTAPKLDEFMRGPAHGRTIIGARDLPQFVQTLKKPRRILLMVKAGSPIDEFISQLIPLLEKGDIIIDGGNSLFTDSQRRYEDLRARGIWFIGTGVSGGEEGARHGPSIMPGGSYDAWLSVKPILQAIAARSEDGAVCCDWVGEGGAGHYVKMIHNGIEYGDMQLICEAFDIMRTGLGMKMDVIAALFSEWNQGKLNSYLIEITAQIIARKDHDGQFLVEKILDAAGQKGTGKWTVMNALDLGMPVSLIAEAVFARCLSAMKKERTQASHYYVVKKKLFKGDVSSFCQKIADALYACKIVSYAQGFMLMRRASEEYRWNLNLGLVALMWRGGCIIRSRFLGKIKEAFDRDPFLANLLLDPFFAKEMMRCQQSLRDVLRHAIRMGVPVSCMSAALAYFDGYRSNGLPANLLQAQRDFFGAHMYERTDKPRGEFFHTNWTGQGGDISSSQYNA
jgi:6-phosphogluconate dehydrogenase